VPEKPALNLIFHATCAPCEFGRKGLKRNKAVGFNFQDSIGLQQTPQSGLIRESVAVHADGFLIFSHNILSGEVPLKHQYYIN
jgi:hypothetical protein